MKRLILILFAALVLIAIAPRCATVQTVMHHPDRMTNRQVRNAQQGKNLYYHDKYGNLVRRNW